MTYDYDLLCPMCWAAKKNYPNDRTRHKPASDYATLTQKIEIESSDDGKTIKLEYSGKCDVCGFLTRFEVEKRIIAGNYVEDYGCLNY